jgi:hypothetical protein
MTACEASFDSFVFSHVKLAPTLAPETPRDIEAPSELELMSSIVFLVRWM